MDKKLFDNVRDYKDTEYTDCIPTAARDDCRGAWKFARDIGCPMNFHIRIAIPEYITEKGQPGYQRTIANKVRVHAADNGYTAFQIIVRSCDPVTKANPTLDILLHVQQLKITTFRKTVASWDGVLSINEVDYSETVMPDGTIKSIFNDLFGATSPEYAAAHPLILHKPSGPVLGDRTFYSRVMWIKHRLPFWKAKREA